MIDAASTIAGLIVGGGLGTIAGGLFAAARWQERVSYLERRLEVVPGFSEDADGIACRDDTIRLQDGQIRRLGRELGVLRAERHRRLAPLKAANEARKQAKIDRDNASRALRNARHAEMRELVGEII